MSILDVAGYAWRRFVWTESHKQLNFGIETAIY